MLKYLKRTFDICLKNASKVFKDFDIQAVGIGHTLYEASSPFVALAR